MSNQIFAEILALSSGINQFSQFQVLNINAANSLFSFAPELLLFSQDCGNQLNQLLQISQSAVFSSLIAGNINLNSNIGGCLEQLLGLEQLVASGVDNLELEDNANLDNASEAEAANATAEAEAAVAEAEAAGNATAVASNATEAVDAKAEKEAKKESKKAKGEKRDLLLQRSGASKKQILSGLGLGLMVVVGAFAI